MVRATGANHVRLLVPYYQRRPELSPEAAIVHARLRERARMRQIPDPQMDMPTDRLPAIGAGRGTRRHRRTGNSTGRPRTLTLQQELEVIELRALGMGKRSIARQLHIGEGCVRHVLDHPRGAA